MPTLARRSAGVEPSSGGRRGVIVALFSLSCAACRGRSRHVRHRLATNGTVGSGKCRQPYPLCQSSTSPKTVDVGLGNSQLRLWWSSLFPVFTAFVLISVWLASRLLDAGVLAKCATGVFASFPYQSFIRASNSGSNSGSSSASLTANASRLPLLIIFGRTWKRFDKAGSQP